MSLRGSEWKWTVRGRSLRQLSDRISLIFSVVGKSFRSLSVVSLSQLMIKKMQVNYSYSSTRRCCGNEAALRPGHKISLMTGNSLTET